jgi:DNA-binding CsgD family transcriptional regulator
LALFAPGLCVESYPERAFCFMRTLVDCDMSTYSELDPAEGTLAIRFDEPDPAQDKAAAGFAAHMHKQPFTNFDPNVAGGGPFMRAEFVSHRQLRDLGVYSEGFQVTGINDHAVIPVHSPDGKIVFGCLERTGKGVFRVELLELMREMQPFLERARELAVAASSVIPALAEPGMLCRLGLTPRQAEVHFWMIHGKANPEIATILGLRHQTVKEHVSAVLGKLGVEHRYAAILRGLEVLRQVAYLSDIKESGREAKVRLSSKDVLPQ